MSKEVNAVILREVEKIGEAHDVRVVMSEESINKNKLLVYFHLNDLRHAPEEFDDELKELVNSIGLTMFEWHDDKFNCAVFVY